MVSRAVLITSLIFIYFVILCNPVGAVQIVPMSQDHYTCYDYSVNFAANNSGWGMVTISNNQWFKGITHIVNYKITVDNVLQIHDGMRKTDYLLAGWENQGYYHFWINETPKRNYKVMQDNSYCLRDLTTNLN